MDDALMKPLLPQKIAYFSMEIALEPGIPTYSGGLGVLSGDTLRSAADLSVPMVAVTLVYSGGYFYQIISPEGNQVEKSIRWDFLEGFKKLPERIKVPVQGKEITVCALEYDVIGATGHIIPVILLDVDQPENEPWQRNLIRTLYDSNKFTRIVQEMILGIGGIRILEALGYQNIQTHHLNEGHSAFLVFELLKKYGSIEEVKKHCVFTTHTPVEAGHETFPYDLANDVFRENFPQICYSLCGDDHLDMTKLAVNSSRYVNGVSNKNRDVNAKMFPGHKIDAITNGIYVNYWVSNYLKNVFDNEWGTLWRYDPTYLENVLAIDEHEIWRAHNKAKEDLFEYEKSHSWVYLEPELLTISYARRITEYKRPLLLFSDLERLAKIARHQIQFIFAGKSHPADYNAKGMIKQLYDFSDYLWDSYQIQFAFLPNYDMDLAKLLIAGSDIWLNNPRRYNEASGTSGMKAALNGVLNLSTLDGWWIEGYKMEPLAGWAIGPGPEVDGADRLDDQMDAESLYGNLEKEILPIWNKNKNEWKTRKKHAIRLAAYFNTHRMVEEYADKVYDLHKINPWL